MAKKSCNVFQALDRASNELRLLLRAALARDPSLGFGGFKDFWICSTGRLGKMSNWSRFGGLTTN